MCGMMCTCGANFCRCNVCFVLCGRSGTKLVFSGVIMSLRESILPFSPCRTRIPTWRTWYVDTRCFCTRFKECAQGYHETAWTINQFARVARKHNLLDVCLNSLSKIYSLPNIEIQVKGINYCHAPLNAEYGRTLSRNLLSSPSAISI